MSQDGSAYVHVSQGTVLGPMLFLACKLWRPGSGVQLFDDDCEVVVRETEI